MPTDLSPRRPDTPPSLQGRYTLYRTLDESERGAVFLGYDQRLLRWRAIEVPADARWAEKLRQEAEILARLEHPAVERVIDLGEDGPIAFVVRDRLQGSAAGHMPMRPSIAAFVVLRIAEGLAHAHARGILHGHLRPSCVKFSDDGSPVITGFGRSTLPIEALAAEHGGDRGPARSLAEEIDGWAFLAPEVREGMPGDARSEVYSLGATLYTLVTGREQPELCFAEAYEGLLTNVPSALRSVILRTCAYDPAERPANVDGFRMLLAPRTESLGSIGDSPWRASAVDQAPPTSAAFVADATLLALMRALQAPAVPTPAPTSDDPFTIEEGLRRVYTMSQPARQHLRFREPDGIPLRRENVPSYIDPQEAAALRLRSHGGTTVSAGTSHLTPVAAPPRRGEPSARASAGRGREAHANTLSVLHVFVGTFSFVLLAIAAFAWFASADHRRDTALTEAVQSEQAWIGAIADASLDRKAVEEAWQAFDADPTAQNAARFIDVAKPAGERFTATPKAKAAVERMARALEAWRGDAP